MGPTNQRLPVRTLRLGVIVQLKENPVAHTLHNEAYSVFDYHKKYEQTIPFRFVLKNFISAVCYQSAVRIWTRLTSLLGFEITE